LKKSKKRIKRFYIPYCEALREISTKVNPTFLLSIHSFTPVYQGEQRSIEIGVLHGHDSTKLAVAINEEMKLKGYFSDANKPYDGITTMGTIKSLIYAKYPAMRQGITFEFRNDILSNKKRSKKLQADTVEIIKKVCQNN